MSIIIFLLYSKFGSEIKKAIDINADTTLVSKTIYPKEQDCSVTDYDIRTHNAYLISMLQERYSSSINYQSRTETSISQARSIYFGILVVILTLMFRSEENKTYKFRVSLVLLGIIIMIYSLEIHLKDMQERQISCNTLTGKVYEKLVSSNDINCNWYEFNCNKRDSCWEGACYNKHLRKLKKAFHPDAEQRIYYIIPWLILSYLAIYFFRKT